MLKNPHFQTLPARPLWLAFALALLAAAAYILIGRSALAVGDLAPSEEPSSMINFTATVYLVGGILILLRYRWLWLFGAIVNAMVILFFFQVYQNRPAVIFSPGGLATKAAEIMLEAVLIYLLILGEPSAD